MPGSLSAACPPTDSGPSVCLSTAHNPPGCLSFPASSKVGKAGRKVRWGGAGLPCSPVSQSALPTGLSGPPAHPPLAPLWLRKKRETMAVGGAVPRGQSPSPSLGPRADYSGSAHRCSLTHRQALHRLRGHKLVVGDVGRSRASVAALVDGMAGFAVVLSALHGGEMGLMRAPVGPRLPQLPSPGTYKSTDHVLKCARTALWAPSLRDGQRGLHFL